MSRKGAFKADDLDDIDDLLPPPPPVAVPVAPVPAPEPVHLDPVAAPTAAKSVRKAPAKVAAETATPKRPRQTTVRAPRTTQSTPEAHVAAVVAEALRQLTHREKQQRGRGRSYGEVVLDAIEQFETELRDHFATAAAAQPKGRLFQRVDHSRPRRRRHAEPPVKIPLAGIIATDVESLDTLAEEWHAGSRSALVDQALKFYLAEEITELAGDAEDSETTEDTSAAI
ncbi:ribbon-helix-helix domain-containing protein [Nocardia heshunensis]